MKSLCTAIRIADSSRLFTENDHESRQDHRHHYPYNSEHSVLRAFSVLARRNTMFHSKLPSLGSLFLRHLIAIVLILFPCPLKAQEQGDDVIKISTDLLLFSIRVKEKHGQAVLGLTERDLSLKDDDRVTSGLYLSPGADRVALMFALDQSGSLRDLISQQRNAALALFDRFGARSSVAVLRFGESANLITPFGRDNAAARAAFIFA